MREIKAHTGLRGLASVAVFLGHAEFNRLWPGAAWFTAIYSFVYWQNPAVDLFFMLSGFVLNYVYLKEKKINWRDYLTARFARICPLYYAGMFAILAMNYLAAHRIHLASSNLQGAAISRNLFLVQEWPFFGVVPSINTPSWSISVEVFLYVCIFPLLALWLSRRRPTAALCAVIIGVALVLNASVANDNPFRWHLVYFNVVRGITGFTAGFLICELVGNRDRPLLPWIGEAALALAIVIVLPLGYLHLALPFLFAALVAVTYSPRSWLGRFLSLRASTYAGTLSYSIYMWHFPVLKVCSLLFAMRGVGGGSAVNPQAGLGAKVFYCCGTVIILLLVSNLSYFCFENPVRRLLRTSRRKPLPQPS